MTALSGAEILAIGASGATGLLGREKAEIGKAFRRLAALWHPDHSADPQATAVFTHLVALRDAALGGTGRKLATSERLFRRADGSGFAMQAVRAHGIDAGELLVGGASLAWRFEPGAADIAEAEISRIAAFRFADAAMEREMRRLLPVIARRIDLEAGGILLVQARSSREVLLVDLIAAHGGAIPPEHVAWIGSGLFNIACWLDWAGLVHGAIGPDTILIDPATHDVRLVGGFGFAVESGRRPGALPARSLGLAPRLAVKGEVADRGLDGDLVRLTLRESLGPAGRASAPEMMQALAMPPETRAIDDYRAWHALLERIWGRRRFQVMDLDGAAIYGI
jgi:hypothetical protein